MSDTKLTQELIDQGVTQEMLEEHSNGKGDDTNE